MAAIAMVLTVFNGCTKEELKTSPEEVIAKTGKADVYLEGDYLVVKSFEAIDSLQKTLQNKSLEEQSSWENQLGLKSAKTFRAQASDKLAGFTNLQQAETYAKELVKDGYFSMIDSSMRYPFYNYSWDCVLNKNGVIKIGDVLYCFQKDAQISIIDGKVKTLNQFLNKPESCDKALVKVYSFPKLKSTTPSNYGLVASKRTYSDGGGVRWDLALYYNYLPIIIYVGPDLQQVTTEGGVRYYLYFHEEKKGLFGWRDSKDIFHHQHISSSYGNCLDPFTNKYFPATWKHYLNTDFYKINSSVLANVYVDVVYWRFGGLISPPDSYYPAPTIFEFSSNGKTDYMPSTVNLTTN